jgi:hypothetical protein
MRREENAMTEEEGRRILEAAGAWRHGTPVAFDYLHHPSKVEKLVELARNLTAPPHYHCEATRRVCEGHLSKPVFWRGRQWAVTKYGVECRDRNRYWVERRRIWEDEKQFGWVRHMAEKNWVDIADFAEALRLARIRWPQKEA